MQQRPTLEVASWRSIINIDFIGQMDKVIKGSFVSSTTYERIRQWPVTDIVAKGLVQWPTNIRHYRLVQWLTTRNGTSVTVRDFSHYCTRPRTLYSGLWSLVYSFICTTWKSIFFFKQAYQQPSRITKNKNEDEIRIKILS